MKKLIATLASTSLLAAAGIALASNSADLALDANRMFFQGQATPLTDPAPANHVRDICVRRACSCQ